MKFNNPANNKTNLKVYVYDNLPKEYQPTKQLPLVSETYKEISKHINKVLRVKDPLKADLFFVPLNIIQFQFKNEDPGVLVRNLEYMTNKKDHIVIALGDFSQRGTKNRFGDAYKKPYNWLDKVCLIALESTSDLDKAHDVAIIPTNTLTNKPRFNTNYRPFLYSFFGELNHPHLPASHIRCKVSKLKSSSDVFIGSSLSKRTKKNLRSNYKTHNDYELISRNSTFTLSPAGYGRWTYRFFQSIIWGSIPILLSDDYEKPFGNYIPYDEFSLTIKEDRIGELDKIIRSIPEGKILEYQKSLRKAQKYFNKDTFFEMLDSELRRISDNA